MSRPSSDGPGPLAGGGHLDALRREAMLTRFDLWVRYFGLGGTADLDRLTAYLAGEESIDRLEHNIIVQAINELYGDVGRDQSVGYAEGS